MPSGNFIKKMALFTAIFFCIAGVLYWVVRESWERESVSTDSVKRTAMAENVGGDSEALQQLRVAVDRLEAICLDLYVQNPEMDGQMKLTIEDSTGNEIAQAQKAYSELVRDGQNTFLLVNPLDGMKDQPAVLRIHTDGGIWLGYGSAVAAGKMEVAIKEYDAVQVGDEELAGCLVIRQQGSNELRAAELYWPCAAVLFVFCMLVILWSKWRVRHQKKDYLVMFVGTVRQYSYLLKQLVFRDFKIKYKASVLGVFWSFLNPLLMTLVYFMIFSTLFTNQEHFVVYLMTGTVLFNYFSESTSQGLYAIVNNAGLITKIYIPKYIFPISKVFSSAINLFISMIPMLFLMALNGLAFTKALLLIPVLVCFMILFCTGLSLFLSSCMVFFRDTQFIWGVFVLMWNFLSPVFYPESIIPSTLIGIYRLNPLYQFMSFLRSITLYGAAPGPACWGNCLLAAFISLAVGLIVFRKTQNKFTIYV